jgi:hypothetical protein
MRAVKRGRRQLGFSRLRYATAPAFVLTLICNSSGIAAPQKLDTSDIVDIIISYYEDNAIFKRDYLGKTFMATMFFDDVGGGTFGGNYFVGFDGINGSAGLTCSYSEPPPNEIIDWEPGRSVSLTGIVYEVVLSNLYLRKCELE